MLSPPTGESFITAETLHVSRLPDIPGKQDCLSRSGGRSDTTPAPREPQTNASSYIRLGMERRKAAQRAPEGSQKLKISLRTPEVSRGILSTSLPESRWGDRPVINPPSCNEPLNDVTARSKSPRRSGVRRVARCPRKGCIFTDKRHKRAGGECLNIHKRDK